ncbi:MAG: ABC transporter ATP-binding protein [Clostridia bacterium]|nr:ABC transporter ATP-binding protein [Clostridia bacterium]
MKRLTKYLKGYYAETVLGPLLKLAEATLELIVPLVIAAIVDRGIAAGDRGFIMWMSLLLVGLGAVGLGFSVTAQYFCAKASVGFITKLRRALFAKMQTLTYTDIDKIGTSTMITRMTADTTRVQTGLNLALRLLLRSPFVVFGAAIMAFTVDVRSALTFVLAIPVLSVIIFGIMLITMPMHKRVQHGTDSLVEKTRENLSGVRVIRAFCKEDEELSDFRQKNGELVHTQTAVGRISALMNPLTYIVINLAIIWLIDIGAVQVSLGKLTSGEVLALYNYMSQILIELIKLANLIITITKALASASRISEALSLTPSNSHGSITEGRPDAPAVELKSVSLTYAGAGAPSLSDISFTALRGETVGIIGGTGSGKTSLINLIPAFYYASEGEVRVFGVEASSYNPHALRKKIGIAPQKAVLFRGSIRDNMLKGCPTATDEEIFSALERAQIKDTVIEKGGLDAEIEQGGANLSGGQKQRLSVARALLGNPEILILDDSSSALDLATDAAMRRAISEIPGDVTVFIVSQRASAVMHADKIIVIDDGRAVGIGTHDELIEECEVYREIYESQFS